MGIILLSGVHMNKKEEKYFRVKIYELDNVRELNIDLNNSKIFPFNNSKLPEK